MAKPGVHAATGRATPPDSTRDQSSNLTFFSPALTAFIFIARILVSRRQLKYLAVSGGGWTVEYGPRLSQHNVRMLTLGSRGSPVRIRAPRLV
jgi:hypothetical protein